MKDLKYKTPSYGLTMQAIASLLSAYGGRCRSILLAATLSIALITGLLVFSSSKSSEIADGSDSRRTSVVYTPSTHEKREFRLLVVTRIHVTSAQSLSAPSVVTSFAKAALEYAQSVLICVSTS